MNDFGVKMNNEPEFPPSLHGHILKRLFFLKTRREFLTVETVLVIGLFFTGWHLWTNLLDLSTGPIFRALFEGFSFTPDFFGIFLESFEDFFPILGTVIFLINLIAVFYLACIYRQFDKLKSLRKD
ncbi:MAG: hypothetical protein NTW60_01645 [Candidatus Wolfebacteria bacterium]|nr:hypothetical protein [Candidatus Wolfebacteria bacterium]